MKTESLIITENDYRFRKTKTACEVRTETAKLLPEDLEMFNNFGSSISISADGSTVIAGGYGNEQSKGAAYVFTREGNSWDLQAKLISDDCELDDDNLRTKRFGWAVAISGNGDIAAITKYGIYNVEKSVYIFTREENSWTEQTRILPPDTCSDDSFGHSLAISADGSVLIIGAPRNNLSKGAVYIYTRKGNSWNLQTELTDTSPKAYNNFGCSVAISSDGSVAVIGSFGKSPDKSFVHIFSKNEHKWHMCAKLKNPINSPVSVFGHTVAISGDGSVIAAGLTYKEEYTKGIVYVFAKVGDVWVQKNKLKSDNEELQDKFGYSISISEDGNIIVVGASGEISFRGCAYVFTRSDSSWDQYVKLMTSKPKIGDSFGDSIVISNDGSVIAVGASTKENYKGSVFMFTNVQGK